MEETKRNIILSDKKIWYGRIFVLMEIVKSLRNRELSFIAKKDDVGIRRIRYLMAHSIDFLKKHLEAIRFENSLANMYQSVAVLKDIPVFSYNFRKRTEEANYIKFNEEYEDHVTGYDLFLDFDGKENFKECHREAQEMKKIFDEYKIPYWLMNSSSNGFHFHIPAEYMPQKKIRETLINLNNVLKNIKAIYDLKSLDETVVDMKRICKVPYSFVRDGTVCLPLDDIQFKSFRVENVKSNTVLRNIIIKNRGLLLRKHNLSEEELKKNTKIFLNEFNE
jgi:hypothetical protein